MNCSLGIWPSFRGELAVSFRKGIIVRSKLQLFFKHLDIEILLVEELLHQLRLVVYPIIHRVILHHPFGGWLFGISEPSTVAIR